MTDISENMWNATPEWVSFITLADAHKWCNVPMDDDKYDWQLELVSEAVCDWIQD